MSSILKALKKLETDTAPQSRQQAAVHLDTALSGDIIRQGLWLQIKRPLLVIVALAVIATGWWLVNNRPAPVPTTLHATVDETPQTGQAPVTPQPKVSTAPQPKPPATPPLAIKQPPFQATPPAAVKSDPPAKPTPKARAPVPPPVNARKPAPPLPTPPDIKPEPQITPEPVSRPDPVRTARPPTPKPIPVPPQPRETAVRVSGADLNMQIQALVWSETPQDRFAVINGQIVREGSSFEGKSIAQIGWDFIEIRAGSKLYRLNQGEP